MARSIAARRKGDEYQARVFWLYLLELRTGDLVDSVCLDSDGVSFVDDVTVTYCQPLCERSTGLRVNRDYYQCKYHMTYGGAFTYENLIDPDFIHCKESMLQRLYNAYVDLSAGGGDTFRLYIVSNWHWHSDDELARHLSEERIRSTFYEGGSSSGAGKVRSAFADHLSISEQELESFLETVRFRLGKNLEDLARELEPRLKLASLRPIDPSVTNIEYDDLAWKLFEQGRNRFDRDSFDQMLHEENLIVTPPSDRSEISICSCLQGARRPRDVQASHMDLTDLFDGRFPRDGHYWQTEIPARIVAFFQSEDVKNLVQPIHLFFDCHLSIAFLAGHLMNPKFGIQIIPVQKTRSSGYELWPEPNGLCGGGWILDVSGSVDTEMVVSISVTNPIENHLLPFLSAAGLEELPRILARPTTGIGQQAISDGRHAWHLGYELQTKLREIIPATCRVVHLFFSGPAALAYILGNTLRHITETVQLYEHDFEGSTSGLRYCPSIRLPVE